MTEIQEPPHEVYRNEVENELIKVIETIEAELWPLNVRVDLVDRGFEVSLTHNPGVPEEVEVSRTYPSEADPSRVAREMCGILVSRKE